MTTTTTTMMVMIMATTLVGADIGDTKKPARKSAKKLARRSAVKFTRSCARKFARRPARKPARKPAKKFARVHARNLARKFARKFVRKPEKPPMTLRSSRYNTHRVFRFPIERGDVTECLVVALETHDNVAQSFHIHSIIYPWPCLSRIENSLGLRTFKFLQHTMASSGAGHSRMEETFLTNLGMLEKIGHEAFQFYQWKFRVEVIQFTAFYWTTVEVSPVNEVIKFMQEVAEFIEMDDLHWRALIIEFHKDDRGAGAKKMLWTLMRGAAKSETVNIFMCRAADEIIDDLTDFDAVKNLAAIDLPSSPSDVSEDSSGKQRVKSAWEYIKEQHQKRGPQGSLIPDEYIQKQEDRIRDLKLAFEETLIPEYFEGICGAAPGKQFVGG